MWSVQFIFITFENYEIKDAILTLKRPNIITPITKSGSILGYLVFEDWRIITRYGYQPFPKKMTLYLVEETDFIFT